MRIISIFVFDKRNKNLTDSSAIDIQGHKAQETNGLLLA